MKAPPSLPLLRLLPALLTISAVAQPPPNGNRIPGEPPSHPSSSAADFRPSAPRPPAQPHSAAVADPTNAEPPSDGGKVAARRPRHQLQGPTPRASGRLGDSLPELTREQLQAFLDGAAEFQAVEDVAGGLGPIFNNASCAICHSAPAIGGSSAALVTRFGFHDGKTFDPLGALGGSLLQAQAIDPGALEKIPDEATIVVRRQSTPLFGAGLIEAIPDEQIQALARRVKPDGILGRAALVEDVATGSTRVGRFGWKAQQATLLSFAGDAYLNEMGVTSRLFPTENAPNADAEKLAQFDQVADPEDVVDPVTGKGDIDLTADFMRFLAPPPAPRVTGTVQVGFNQFVRVGCAECHVPTLFTGPSKVRALDRKPVTLFSDLLLHDMGSLNDGIEQADARGNEMKTAPLWGLKHSAPFLHDGRAPTVADAILAHDGEGAASRDRFHMLTAHQQKQLLDFLNGL